jgi:uncharacterized lipoprotein NlpE involved in copper resistance
MSLDTQGDYTADAASFLIAHQGEIEAKLAAAREQIARGEARPLEPLDALLLAARAHAAG